MQLADYFYVGEIIRKYSFKGEVIILVNSDYTEIITKTESVYITLGENLVPFFMEKKSWQKAEQLRVQFEDVNSEAAANPLIHKKVYLPNTLLPEREGLYFYKDEIVGFKVEDTQYGYVGIVKGINDRTPQILLEVEDENGIVMIPINAFVKEIKRNTNTIIVETPEGLLDLRF